MDHRPDGRALHQVATLRRAPQSAVTVHGIAQGDGREKAIRKRAIGRETAYREKALTEERRPVPKVHRVIDQ